MVPVCTCSSSVSVLHSPQVETNNGDSSQEPNLAPSRNKNSDPKLGTKYGPKSDQQIWHQVGNQTNPVPSRNKNRPSSGEPNLATSRDNKIGPQVGNQIVWPQVGTKNRASSREPYLAPSQDKKSGLRLGTKSCTRSWGRQIVKLFIIDYWLSGAKSGQKIGSGVGNQILHQVVRSPNC